MTRCWQASNPAAQLGTSAAGAGAEAQGLPGASPPWPCNLHLPQRIRETLGPSSCNTLRWRRPQVPGVSNIDFLRAASNARRKAIGQAELVRRFLLPPACSPSPMPSHSVIAHSQSRVPPPAHCRLPAGAQQQHMKQRIAYPKALCPEVRRFPLRCVSCSISGSPGVLRLPDAEAGGAEDGLGVPEPQRQRGLLWRRKEAQ